MPSIDEATELCSSELDQNDREAEILCESRTSLEEPEASIPALLAVICHKFLKIKDEISLPADCPSQEDYSQVLLPCECSNWDLKRKLSSTSLKLITFDPAHMVLIHISTLDLDRFKRDL